MTSPSREIAYREELRTQRWLQVIADEYARAAAEFGPFSSAHEGYAVILEELDELWDEIKGHARHERMRAEAAMALRFLIDTEPTDG